VVRGDTGAPVRGADVIAFRTTREALERRTNAAGRARFGFRGPATRLRWLYVYHEEPGVWGCFRKRVQVKDGAVTVRLAPLDLSRRDSLRHFHRAGSLRAGRGVRVGVIDSGADMHHPDLEDAIEGGANCVPESVRPPGDFGPDDAHGTHVAGTIAARGTPPGGVRGVAPGARLRIYRVFEAGNQSSGSSFAIIDAVERAIEDRCDIINLSLGFDPGVTDDAVSDALRKARNHGILAVAAAGNGGREPVEFPGGLGVGEERPLSADRHRGRRRRQAVWRRPARLHRRVLERRRRSGRHRGWRRRRLDDARRVRPDERHVDGQSGRGRDGGASARPAPARAQDEAHGREGRRHPAARDRRRAVAGLRGAL
jgi:subtilisin family serine protease